jgi:hypothetical protein
MVVIERHEANRALQGQDASPQFSLHYARVIIRRGFGVGSSILFLEDVREGKTGEQPVAATVRASNGTFQKCL